MKKFIMCLCMSTMLLGLVACGNNENSNNEVAQEEIPEYKEFVDPRGKSLDHTATGESAPKLVDTLYETEDVVVADYIPTDMGYAVDPTGETDSTLGIQRALDDCSAAGGGTVFLPAGNYAISDTIYIPPFVTLRGDWNDPDGENFDGTYGTIISVWMESEDEEIAGAFKLGGSAGAVGLTVYYPEQSLDCIRPYAYTFYVDGAGANYMLQTIKNVTIINGYRGIGTSYDTAHEELLVDNVKGTFLKCGLSLYNSADVSVIDGVSISNRYWKEASADCMNAVSGSAIDDYTKRYTTGMAVSDEEWTQFSDIAIDGCAIGMHVVKGARTAFAGSIYDMTITNCEQGVLCDDMDDRWGSVLASSYIEGGITNNSDGKWKMCDVEVKGDKMGISDTSFMEDTESDLSTVEIDYNDSYVKPASNLIIAEISEGFFVDASLDVQVALDKMHEQGGGVVYVPSGIYRFRSPITVPEGVELRGSSSVSTRDQNNCSQGTIFYCYYGDDDENGIGDQAFITLEGENSGLNGIRIIYPENSAKNENINTTYTVRGKASGVYIVNTMIAASAYGVDFRDCDNHYIEGVITCCYYNAFRLGGANGNMNKCLQNGTIIPRTGAAGLSNWINEAEMFISLLEPVLRKECTYIIIEDAENQLIYNTFIYGCKTMIQNTNSEDTLLVNLGSDNINADAPQILVDGGGVTGINIMRFNGYSYDLVKGNIAFYTRMAIDEAGERTLIKSE